MTYSPSSASAPASAARAWGFTMAAALAAGLITWAAGESLMRDETGTGSRGGATPVSPVVHMIRNGMVSYGLLGGTLALGLGLAGGLIRRSIRSAAAAGLLGLILGGAAGAGAAGGLVPFYFRNYSGSSLTVPLLAHGGIWTSIAIAAGLAFGMGIGGPRRAIEALIHAVAGALLATFIYEFAAVAIFPTVQTDRPLPVSSGSRLFAHLVVALVIAAALAVGSSRARTSAAAPNSTAS